MAEPVLYRRQAATDILMTALTDFDRELRIAAALALGQIGLKSASEALRGVQNDPDQEVKVAATRALEMLSRKQTSDTRLVARGDLFQI